MSSSLAARYLMLRLMRCSLLSVCCIALRCGPLMSRTCIPFVARPSVVWINPSPSQELVLGAVTGRRPGGTIGSDRKSGGGL